MGKFETNERTNLIYIMTLSHSTILKQFGHLLAANVKFTGNILKLKPLFKSKNSFEFAKYITPGFGPGII